MMGFFSMPPLPYRFWGPCSFLFSGYRGILPWGLSGRSVKLTVHLNNALFLPDIKSWTDCYCKLCYQALLFAFLYMLNLTLQHLQSLQGQISEIHDQ